MWRVPCSPCLGVLRVAGCRTQQGSGGGFVLRGSVQSLRWRSSKSAADFLQQKRGDGPSFASRRNPRNMDAPMPQEADVGYNAGRDVMPQSPRHLQYDDFQEKRTVAQRDKGVKFKSLRMRTDVKNNLMKGAFLYFIIDTGVWMAAGSLLQLAGFIDVTWQTNVITTYPMHSYIPTEGLKSAFLVVATSGLWAHGYLFPYRIPIICMGGLFMAARMTSAMKTKNVDYMEGFKVIFPDDFLKKHGLLGVELVTVFLGCTGVLTYIGFGEWVHVSANETFYSYFTSYNDTLRGILGTNDWPTDETLTCASLACLGVELYTMARVRLGRGLAITLRNMMKA
eukprot:TRINITY_DN36940_c0_g1_i1.p1 TRINITY_DN36940_c0_g1~~TRINITY_DN36940_c0_g1_i1.p1  ORF type:complete len:338 (+),score=68.28 TRINITY_DN36940_c0_g1_i1:66-1079(+)